jgi:3''-phosphoadenosine 5''-phosphosulfate sulfotransferase (PAPS reductase)/FAD synthetase and related enzymes
VNAHKERHILGLSGGRDSAALAVLMHKRVPQMEYFFCDTGKELDETTEYLNRLRARLGITITRLQAERGFDHWLSVYNGLLPSPKMRWCTKKLKIEPLEEFIGDDQAVSYVGIRADETRDGYVSTKPNIRAVFPLRDEGIDKAGVVRILEEAGIGLPDYYRWRTRSGCYFCFFQRKIEWVRLADEHPDLFAKAVAYEEGHSDGRRFTWASGETLRELLERREQIEADSARRGKILDGRLPANAPLAQVLAAQFDDDDDEQGCVICHV